jgi:hypothetical protein
MLSGEIQPPSSTRMLRYCSRAQHIIIIIIIISGLKESAYNAPIEITHREGTEQGASDPTHQRSVEQGLVCVKTVVL